MEAYLDGKLIHQFGDMRQDPPLPLYWLLCLTSFLCQRSTREKSSPFVSTPELSNIGPSGEAWLWGGASRGRQRAVFERARTASSAGFSFAGACGDLSAPQGGSACLPYVRLFRRLYRGLFDSPNQVQSFLIDWLFWAHTMSLRPRF